MFMPTDGHTARSLAAGLGQPVVVYDLTASPGTFRAWDCATSANVRSGEPCSVRRNPCGAEHQGPRISQTGRDLLSCATVAMLANEAFEAVLQACGWRGRNEI